jgi:hypothetical protein
MYLINQGQTTRFIYTTNLTFKCYKSAATDVRNTTRKEIIKLKAGAKQINVDYERNVVMNQKNAVQLTELGFCLLVIFIILFYILCINI